RSDLFEDITIPLHPVSIERTVMILPASASVTVNSYLPGASTSLPQRASTGSLKVPCICAWLAMLSPTTAQIANTTARSTEFFPFGFIFSLLLSWKDAPRHRPQKRLQLSGLTTGSGWN